MRYQINLLFLAVAALLAGCSAPKAVTSYQTNATQAEAEGNFEAATENWRLYFDQQMTAGNEVSPEMYAKAANTAIKANQEDLALKWFEQAKSANYADEKMYLTMADIYRQNNRLAEEMEILETYNGKYGSQTDSAGINVRLFEIYTQTNNQEKAAELWPSLRPEDQKQEKYLDKYFSFLKQSGHTATNDSLAEVLLEVNPEHVKALEWLGEKYYQRAEERYNREMKKYENNKTHVQHFHLVQELKTVTADFQKSLTYFKKLWEIKQDPYYAPYLVNIYTRFEDKEKANYYRKFLN